MRVLLLAGGNSSENQVSLNSGAAIYHALCRSGHQVTAMDPASGRSLIGADGRYQKQLPDSNSQATGVADSKALAVALAAPMYRDAEVVFIALHGGAGENGTIQSLLDLCGKKYTGSGMAASAIAMNKAVTKRLFASAGISTPDWELYRYDGPPCVDVIAGHIAGRFSFPIIVKPNDGGSTVGLTKVNRESELPEAIRKSAHESKEVLVEEYIAGRELTVSVLDGEALPVVEIRPKKGLYDYEAKYTKGMSEYLAPAPVEAKIAEAVQLAASKAFEIIGASGLVRVDFIYREPDQIYCLEVNTLPGMTNLSLAPMAAKCVGMSFDQLVERIIQSALRK
ncbi:MAG TPA: D-alanine--D-alanine ligase [Candidatus Acidoferrum sp.]|nr:D-alanine--D-alanine ligase [Candidatus Acidoferrum sp.]